MTGDDAAQIERAAANKARSQWFVIDTVHEPGSGEVLWVNAVYAADDPLFRFHSPADYPRLGERIVEMANRAHRKAHRVYARTALDYDSNYWNAIHSGEALALKRMAIHALRPWSSGGILLSGVGGWITECLPPLSGDVNVDWLGEMVVELVALRAAKDFATADALRREMVFGAGAHLYLAKDGIEFIDAKQWK